MFKEYLLYIEQKNIHQLHIEQFSLQGINELRNAINIFRDLRNDLLHNGVSNLNVSTKFDGAPSLVAGINPENKKFFVSTKSAFTKTPKLAYTKEDINNLFGSEGLKDKLQDALKYFPLLNMDGIYQGDLMFNDNIKKSASIDGKEFYTFTPNTITYAVEKNSDLGKKIGIAKIGIIFHTKYEGETIAELSAKPASSLPFRKVNDVWFIPAAMTKDYSGVINFTTEDANSVTKKLSTIGGLFNKLDKAFYEGLKEAKLDVAIETTVNRHIRNGKFFDDLDNFIVEVKDTANDVLSGKRARMSIQYIQDNRDKIISMMQIYKLLFEIKNIFVDKFSHMKNDLNTFIQTDDGFKATKPEGFVVVNDKGMTKLVDRLDFSKNNFNFVKDWGK